MYLRLKTNCKKYTREAIIVSIVGAIILCSNLFFVSCEILPARPQLTSAETCKPCHTDIYNTFIKTAHYFDSRPADSSSIKGSFEEGKNIYHYNLFMDVVMTREGNDFKQSGRVNGVESQYAYFDMVIGSGRNGQTYLFWLDNQLYQLPVSYYAPAKQWCNSPGFPNYFFFGRQIPPNCLECHTTAAKTISRPDSVIEYDKSGIVYGITCARCHPGADEHVKYQTAHPDDKQAKFVTNTAHLDRQLRMDACALCHSGLRTAIQPPFSFKAGDTLEKFSHGSPISARPDTLDVHGNQYGLLAASKCYIKSTTMDCSTCHDVHKNQYKDLKLFSEKCMTCHNADEHPKLKMKKNIVISENCIDCHMPVLASKKIELNVKVGQELIPDYLRTHYISIYPVK